MATIFHRIDIHSNKEAIYQAITTQGGLSRWWLPDCTAKEELGFVNEFKVNDKITNKMKITDLQPNVRVKWECIDSVPEWVGTQIIFEIDTDDGVLFLNFKHAGWKKQTKFCAYCNYHWGRHLSMLKNLCETGSV